MKRIVALLLVVLLTLPLAAVMNITASADDEWKGFWLTHYNSVAVEASGVIVTSQDYNTNQAWRLVVSFSPVGGNCYEIVEIVNYLETAEDTYHIAVPDGGFLYLLNMGNDYTSTGGVRYYNDQCAAAIADALTWQEGEIFEFVNLNLESLTAPTLTPSVNWYADGYVCTAKYRKYSEKEELAVESIVVDGKVNDSGWTSDWTVISGTTGTWQKAFSDTSINAEYQIRSDNNYLYVAAVINTKPVAGTGNGSATNLRVWFNTTNAAKYTAYYDIFYNGTSAGVNTNITGTGAYAAGSVTSSAFTLEIAIPFSDIGADNLDQIPYYMSISTNTGSEEPCLYYPKMSSYSSPYSAWLKNCDGDLSKLAVKLNNFDFTLSTDGSYYILSDIGTYGSKNVTIPDSYNGKPVKEIGAQAFSQSNIVSVIIPDTINSIGQAAFSQCTELVTIDLGGTDDIGFGAFAGCTALAAIDLSEVSNIAHLAFSSCVGIKTVHIPVSVSSVGSNVFAFCENLTDIYCGASAKPASWENTWIKNCDATVHWSQAVHTHSYGTDWITNTTHHWHSCSCGSTADYAAHVEGEWVTLDDGRQELRCTVCNELIDFVGAPKYAKGDVNADGVIDMFDYLLIKGIYFENYIPTDAEFNRADVNDDKVVDMFDYLLVKTFYFES